MSYGSGKENEKKRAPQRPFPASGRNTVFQASLLQAGASVRLGHLDPVQPLRQGACVPALGELDAQAHLVGRVGVAQRVLVGALAGLVELEPALVEGLHAQRSVARCVGKEWVSPVRIMW